jgi:hypothetical protein
MHFTQTIIGGVAVIGALQFAVLEPVKRSFLPTPKALEIRALEYTVIDGVGHVRQHIAPTQRGMVIEARWVAQIERPLSSGSLQLLCSGSGVAPYSGTVATWPLAAWAAPSCPTVAAIGDILEAAWTWQNERGHTVSIGGRYVLTDEGLQLVGVTE